MITKRIFLALIITVMTAISGLSANPPVLAQTVEQSDSQAAGQGGLLDLLERAKQAQINAFTGSWEGVLTPEEGGPPPFQILFTFGADGTVVVSDAGPPTPQLNTAEHGAWERTGDHEFTIIYKQLLFDSDGNLNSTFKGRVKFKLNEAGTEISGLVKVDIYDLHGSVIISGAGTVKCTKIRVEPLD